MKIIFIKKQKEKFIEEKWHEKSDFKKSQQKRMENNNQNLKQNKSYTMYMFIN